MNEPDNSACLVWDPHAPEDCKGPTRPHTREDCGCTEQVCAQHLAWFAGRFTCPACGV